MVGGAFAALGVLGMHYLGMMAQRTNADMSFDMGIVASSVVIAFVTANAAFWILFRAVRTLSVAGVTVTTRILSSTTAYAVDEVTM